MQRGPKELMGIVLVPEMVIHNQCNNKSSELGPFEVEGVWNWTIPQTSVEDPLVQENNGFLTAPQSQSVQSSNMTYFPFLERDSDFVLIKPRVKEI